MISGRTSLIAHLGSPTESFKAPMIYNPWFERKGIDSVVVPMGVRAQDYPAFLRLLFRISNVHGALVTMPHKAATVALLDQASPAVRVAGSCNAILRRDDGSLYGDMFEGEGFARGARRKGFEIAGADCLVVGAGGVGSAIAASIADRRPRLLALFDTRRDAAEALAGRGVGDRTAAGHRPASRAASRCTAAPPIRGPCGRDPRQRPGRLCSRGQRAFVGEVVLSAEMTPLLRAAAVRGCRYLVGTDMLFEQIPAYLEFFGYGATTTEELRAAARVSY